MCLPRILIISLAETKLKYTDSKMKKKSMESETHILKALYDLTDLTEAIKYYLTLIFLHIRVSHFRY